MQPEKQFAQFQRQLADYCRTDVFHELPGTTSSERVETYRSLVFNGVESALSKAYPITKVVLQEDWDILVRKFFAEYPSQSPHLWQMPSGLVDYVAESKCMLPQYPFLSDLLTFEWVEIEVYMMEDLPATAYQRSGDVLTEKLVLNPELQVLMLEYPVFRMSAEILKEQPAALLSEKGSYPLLCYRHPDSLRAYFFELSPFYLQVLVELQATNSSGEEALLRVAARCNLENEPDLIASGEKFLNELLQQKVILGFEEGI